MILCASGVKRKTAFIAFLFFSSCTASQESASTASTVNEYLKMVQGKVQSTWKYPTGVVGSHVVTLLFVLDVDGKLVNAEVINATDERLSQSALDAINRASPFPPIPENLKKLAGEPLVMKFAVSIKPK